MNLRNDNLENKKDYPDYKTEHQIFLNKLKNGDVFKEQINNIPVKEIRMGIPCDEDDKPVKEDYSIKTFQTKDSIWNKLKSSAEEKGLKFYKFIEKIFIEYLENEDKQNK